VVRDFAKFGEAEDLVAAGIGENGARPRHEAVQSTELADEFMPRAQIQMVGVGEDDFRAEFFERLIAQCLDGSLRAHRHEERSLGDRCSTGGGVGATATEKESTV